MIAVNMDLNYGAIDIGSNAVRFKIASFSNSEGKYAMTEKFFVRLPVNLGYESFSNQHISAISITKLIQSINAYQSFAKLLQVQKIMAVATSALRYCNNGQQVITAVQKSCGIKIEIISPAIEIDLVIFAIDNLLPSFSDGFNLHFDLGGGSCEYAVYKDSKIIEYKSFDTGVIRIRDAKINNQQWSSILDWLASMRQKYNIKHISASGGCLLAMLQVQNILLSNNINVMSADQIKNLQKLLLQLPALEMATKFKLTLDQAELVKYGFKAINLVIEQFPQHKFIFPKIGVIDGLLLKSCGI